MQDLKKTLMLAIMGIALFPLTNHAQTWLTNGLVAYYPFNGNANDASGNGHNGVVNGGSISPTNDNLGVPNAALHFGGGSYISVTPTPINVSANWTISFWCTLDTPDSGADNFVSSGVDIANGLNLRFVGTNWWTLIATWAGGGAGSGCQYNATNGYNPRNWNMFTCVRNGNSFEIFLNNALVASNTVVGATLDSGTLWFGRHQASACCYYDLLGSLSEARIYNRALSTNEIQQLYAYESGPPTQDPFSNGLVAYYPFDGNANDASGNGNNGVAYGTTLVADRFGIPNKAMDFGVGNYIEVASTAQLKFSTQFTVTAWIRPNSFAAAHAIITKNPSDGWGGWEFMQNNSYGVTVEGKFGGQNTAGGCLNVLATNRWQHVAAIYDGNSMKMEVNGVLVPLSISVGQYSGPVLVNDVPLRLGRRASPNDLWFLGQMDDIRIYNRAMSTNEVQQLYVYESGPRVNLMKAVKPLFSNLTLTTNYQLQVSGDLSNWTNQGSSFTATDTSMIYPQYWDVDNWGKLYFRLQVVP